MAEGYAGFHHSAVRAARLLHNKKHRLDRRCFLIEGRSLLEAALAAGAKVEHVFVLDEGADDFAPLHSSAAVLRVDRRTLASLSQTQTPQGIIAVVGFVDRSADMLATTVPAAGPALTLVLPNLSDPGNAGTLIRSAQAFGVSAVCFGPHAVDPYNDKVVRSSMGSLFRVPIVRYESWEAFLPAVRAARLSLVGADAAGYDVRTITATERTALVIGQERHGLTEIPRSDFAEMAAIPHVAGVESLNAAVAGSILLYELSRANGLLGPSGPKAPPVR